MSTQTQIRLPDTIYNRIEAAAKASGLSKNDIIKMALDAGLRLIEANDYDIAKPITNKPFLDNLFEIILHLLDQVKEEGAARDAALKVLKRGKPRPGARPWPENALRHSFVSYHLALYGDVARTEMQAGHDRKVLFAHYRELVTKDAAEDFWAVHLAFHG
jgi:predicted DNA-binding protein